MVQYESSDVVYLKCLHYDKNFKGISFTKEENNGEIENTFAKYLIEAVSAVSNITKLELLERSYWIPNKLTPE